MKKKTTVTSLVLSALSMLLCISMLVGTSFAWFTDSVTSMNRIIAGNLDVTVYYSTTDPQDPNSWHPLDGTTQDLFQSIDGDSGTEDLWEPGHMEVVYLRVVNEGTLALKYQISVTGTDTNTPESVAGNTIFLSQYLKFGQAKSSECPAKYTRDTALQTLANVEQGLKTYTEGGKLEATGDEYVSLVVYMPDDIGNLANAKDPENLPSVNLKLNVLATQYTFEKDSFDASYDQDATYDIADAKVTQTIPVTLENGKYVTQEAATLTAKAQDSKGVATAEIPAGTLLNNAEGKLSLEVRKAPAPETKYYIVLEGLAEDNQTLIKVTAENFLYAGLNGVKLDHKDTPMTGVRSEGAITENSYFYNKDTGKFVLGTKSISDFNVVYDGNNAYVIDGSTKVSYTLLTYAIRTFTSVAEGQNVADAPTTTIKLVGNMNCDPIEVVGRKNVTLDMNGYTLNSNIIVYGQSVLTIEGGSYVGTISNTGGGQTTIKNGYYEVTSTGKLLVSNNSDMTIEGGTFDGKITSGLKVKLTITDGIFAEEISAVNLTINGGTFNGLISAKEAGIITVYSGTFNNIFKSGITSDTNIHGGQFNGDTIVQGRTTITGGVFDGNITEEEQTVSTTATLNIESGTFNGDITLNGSDRPYCGQIGNVIKNGVFNGKIILEETTVGNTTIMGGIFKGGFEVDPNAKLTITGGTFVNFDPTNYLPKKGYTVQSEAKENNEIWYTVVPVQA